MIDEQLLRESFDLLRRDAASGVDGQSVADYESNLEANLNNLDHGRLLNMLRKRIDDEAFVRLVGKWLSAGVLEEDGQIVHPATGTPQGGIVSPVLANVCLHYGDLHRHCRKQV